MVGHCKHGEFELEKGCLECMAEREAEKYCASGGIIPGPAGSERQIVKVRYHSETTGELSAREYTYYSADRLSIGDIVFVPVKDRNTKAKVSAIDVPESEIASFKDKVKTIPAKVEKPTHLILSESMGNGESLEELADKARAIIDGADTMEVDRHQFSAPEPLSEEAREVLTAGRDTMIDAVKTWEPTDNMEIISVNPEADPDYIGLKTEVEKLVLYADKRTVTNKEESELATNDLAFIAKLTKAVEERRVEYVKPLNDYVSQFNLAFKKLSEPLKEAKRITDHQIMTYQRQAAEERRKAEEAQAIANAEALRKAQEIKEGTGEIVEVEPEHIELPPEATTKVRTDFGTASQVDNWKYEIVDRPLVPAEFWVIDETSLGKQVRAGRHDIPGVRIYNEPILRTRG